MTEEEELEYVRNKYGGDWQWEDEGNESTKWLLCMSVDVLSEDCKGRMLNCNRIHANRQDFHERCFTGINGNA
jgi:hypothetical protein